MPEQIIPAHSSAPITTYIYGLVDPRDGCVRYVGKANDARRRLRRHLLDRACCRKVRWIQTLATNGLQPGLVILEEADAQHWQEAERKWILQYGRDNLTNETDGGESGKSGLARSAETRKAISEALRGKPLSEATKRSVSIALKGHPVSAETRAKLSLAGKAQKGKPLSDEHRRKLSLAGSAGKGKPKSDEWRAKHSALAKEMWQDPQYQAKQNRALKGNQRGQGHKLSDEHKLKLKRANMARKEKPWTDAQRAANGVKSEVTRGKLSAAQRALWQDPEYRAVISAALQKTAGVLDGSLPLAAVEVVPVGSTNVSPNVT